MIDHWLPLTQISPLLRELTMLQEPLPPCSSPLMPPPVCFISSVFAILAVKIALFPENCIFLPRSIRTSTQTFIPSQIFIPSMTTPSRIAIPFPTFPLPCLFLLRTLTLPEIASVYLLVFDLSPTLTVKTMRAGLSLLYSMLYFQ